MLRSILVIAVGALVGCVSSPGDDLPEFGSTVGAAKALQTWKEGDNVPALHGDSASGKIQAYRRRATPKDVGTAATDITLN